MKISLLELRSMIREAIGSTLLEFVCPTCGDPDSYFVYKHDPESEKLVRHVECSNPNCRHFSAFSFATKPRQTPRLSYKNTTDESLVYENEKKPSDPRKKIGKVVKYLDRPFKVRDVMMRHNPLGYMETLYIGVFEDEQTGMVYYAPADKITKGPSNRAKKPEDFDPRTFVEEDIEAFLRAPDQNGTPNIHNVRSRWAEISTHLSWMEKYIFDSKWLNTPMAKTNEQLAAEMQCKIGVVRATETRAFRKIEKIVTGDGDVFHDLEVIRQARNMHKNEQPMAKIMTYLNAELKNKDWLTQIDFIK